MENIALLTDGYKFTHWRQYPPGTEYVYSYFESRGGEYRDVLFFGLQAIIKRHLLTRVTQENIDEAEEVVAAHLGDKALFNRAGWEHIILDHQGKLPIRIKAVPEGTPVPKSNVLMTVENTCPKCYWVTNYLETLLSQVWYPCTVATQSRECKRIILDALVKTGDPKLVDFKLHDFGFRGVSSVVSAGLGGLAHLVNFRGTDTTVALMYARRYYGESMAGFSIPAAEHSTITSWGRESEVEAFQNMIRQYGSGAPGLYAVVSDSYDIFAAVKELWGKQLKAEVLAAPNTLVVRPDSGDPVSTVIQILDGLGECFGFTVNEKGYKVLNPKVRVIQGDGVDFASIRKILDNLEWVKWSADNLAFGMGGALLQRLNRDTLKFAFKCSAIKVEGMWRDVYKEPITDPGKNSKRGRLVLVRTKDGFKTLQQSEVCDDPTCTDPNDVLETVYEDGVLVREQTLADVRVRAEVAQ